MDRWMDVSAKIVKVFIEEMSLELILENPKTNVGREKGGSHEGPSRRRSSPGKTMRASISGAL